MVSAGTIWWRTTRAGQQADHEHDQPARRQGQDGRDLGPVDVRSGQVTRRGEERTHREATLTGTGEDTAATEDFSVGSLRLRTNCG